MCTGTARGERLSSQAQRDRSKSADLVLLQRDKESTSRALMHVRVHHTTTHKRKNSTNPPSKTLFTPQIQQTIQKTFQHLGGRQTNPYVGLLLRQLSHLLPHHLPSLSPPERVAARLKPPSTPTPAALEAVLLSVPAAATTAPAEIVVVRPPTTPPTPAVEARRRSAADTSDSDEVHGLG